MEMNTNNTIFNELDIFMRLNDLNEGKPLVQVETSNDNLIQAFGTTFKFSKARDFEIIVDAEGRINYTKLLTQITGDRNKLKHICEHNSSILEVIRSYDEDRILAWSEKFVSNSMAAFTAIAPEGNNSLPETLTISQLKQACIFTEHRGGSKEVQFLTGTYGPRYLLDILIILTRPSYYRLIHELLETIDNGSHLKNRSFDEELRRTIAQKQEENEQLKAKFNRISRERDQACKRLNKKNRDLHGLLREMNKKLDNQTLQLTQANTQLHEANTKIDHQTNLITNLQDIVVEGAQQTRNKIDELGSNLHNEFSRMNVTTGSRGETIDIWTNSALNLNFHFQGLADDNEEVLDTFAGDINHPERINQHSVPPERGIDECLGSFSNANAIDICVYAKEHIDEYPHLRFYSPTRKLIVQLGHRDEAISFIRNYASQGETHITNLVRTYRNESLNVFGGLIERLQGMINEQHDEIREINSVVHENRNEIQAIHNDVQNGNNDLHELRDEMNANVQEMNTQLHEIRNIQEQMNARLQELTMRERLLNTYPSIQTENLEGFINKRYRLFRIDDEGRIWYQPYVGAQYQELSLDQLQTIIFRDRAGHKYRNGQMI